MARVPMPISSSKPIQGFLRSKGGVRSGLDAVGDFHAKTSVGVAVSALFLLTPFAVNNFLRDRPIQGAVGVGVVAVLLLNMWLLLRGRRVRWLTPLVLTPLIIGFLIQCFETQGVIAAFWCPPAIIALYFMLPEKQARMANLVFLAGVVPQAWRVLAPDLAIRVAVTLLAVSIFSAIAMSILTSQQRMLRRIAVIDPLTGVLNRTALDGSLERAVHQRRRSGTSMAMIAIDLDHFKAVNDTFGHDAGDMVLRTVGTTLLEHVRGSDQVFRLGGEEFLVVLYDSDAAHAEGIAEEFRAAIADLELPSGPITASFGVAGLRAEEDWQAWLRRCDRHLYRAKAEGRNRVVADVEAWWDDESAERRSRGGRIELARYVGVGRFDARRG